MFVVHLMENRRFHQRQRQIDGMGRTPVEPLHRFSHRPPYPLLTQRPYPPFPGPKIALLQSPEQQQAPEAVALCCRNLRNRVLVRFQSGRQQPDREDRPCQPF